MLVARINIVDNIQQFNLNNLNNRSKGNMYASNRKKRESMNRIFWQIRGQVKGMLCGAYEVKALWRVPTKGRDLDNYLLKNVFDCMQENGMLKNDNLNHIVKIIHEFEIVDQSKQGLIVEFYESSSSN